MVRVNAVLIRVTVADSVHVTLSSMTTTAASKPRALLSTGSWALYDFSDTIFSASILTFYFPLWVTEDKGGTDTHLGIALSASMLIVALTGPFLGTLSDRLNRRVPLLAMSVVTCAVFTALIGAVGGLTTGLLFFIAANFMYQTGLIFYNSLIINVSSESGRGIVSGIGIGAGYIGLIAAFLIMRPLVDAEGNQAAFLPTAGLFILFALPLILIVRDPGKRGNIDKTLIQTSYKQLYETFHRARQHVNLFRFLIGRFMYMEAINTVTSFFVLYLINVGDFEDTDFVAGVYRFTEDGANRQHRTVFLGFPGAFALVQELDSTALFANIERTVGDRWRLGAGVRTTRDTKRAETDVGIGPVRASRSWRETSWNLAVHYAAGERRAFYGNIQSGYQSGQFPARAYCLFADPTCFQAGDNITALNYEVGFKGQPTPRLELRAAVFHTRYDDLPYQVSTTAGQGFNTVNLIVEQRTTGVEWESTLYVAGGLWLHAAVGYLDVDVAEQQGVRPVAPLTPERTLSISPEYRWPLAGGGEISGRLDYSYRDAMWGEPSADPGRLTAISSRSLVNFHLGYVAPGNTWSAAIYGRNAGDVRYDQARLNTGDYLLRILSNDASEFGIRLGRRL